MRPEDLSSYRTPSDPRTHPDGTRVAFVVSQMDLDEDRYHRQIWLWDGTSAAPFTAGPADAAPRWSPDGSRLAFLRSAGKKEPAQVYVMPTDGGEARKVTDIELGVSGLEWSPDGTRIAVVGKVWAAAWADLEEDERSRRPRRITRPYWRADNAGWVHDRHTHVFVVAVDDDSEAVLLTPGDLDEVGVAWHPDSSRIAFVSARHDERHFDPGRQVWEIDAAGGEPRALTDVGVWDHVSYSPQGVAHVIGLDDPWAYPSVSAIFRVDDDGSLVDLTGALDRNPLPFTPAMAPRGPQWQSGGFLSTLEDDGAIRAIAVHGDGSIEEVAGGDRVITGLSAGPTDGFAFVATTPTDPGELYWHDANGERVLTDLNGEFRRTAGLVEPVAFRFESDGIEIQAWAYLPPGDDNVPLLLNIHGGPATQYGHGFFDEFQVYAAAGYGVLACNPRGSSGRGRDFARAVVGKWQGDDLPDMRDFVRLIDTALERFPRFDAARIGVMGGSYGGFATLRLLAMDDRFGSAVAERALASFLSFAGTSDIGLWFNRIYLATSSPEDWQEAWSASPMASAHEITTPTLVIHSENDFRCPIEQGEQVFLMLQRMDVPSELIRFPDESHELSRSGAPRHRRERFDYILDWHGRHL